MHPLPVIAIPFSNLGHDLEQHCTHSISPGDRQRETGQMVSRSKKSFRNSAPVVWCSGADLLAVIKGFDFADKRFC
jgi:hypothetical protein